MLSSQRGYLLSGDPKLYALYEEKKAQVGNTLQQLRDLTVGNPGQLARIDVMDHAEHWRTALGFLRIAADWYLSSPPQDRAARQRAAASAAQWRAQPAPEAEGRWRRGRVLRRPVQRRRGAWPRPE
jgi:hypothetical protein